MLDNVDLVVPEGELCLVVGATGTGKSTLLRADERARAALHRRDVVRVRSPSTAGRPRDRPPRDLADVVGVVGQDPAAGFVTDTVEDELAYAMENLGVAPDVMRRRVEDVLDLLDLHDLRDRPLATLSGGQQQRVAIGSVLTAHPRVLVLDEPTSALDPAAAEEVLAALTRLVHDLGITVLVAEHRLERVVQYADRDRARARRRRARSWSATPAAGARRRRRSRRRWSQLGRLAGWTPLPLSVRDDARRLRAGAARPARTVSGSDAGARRMPATVVRDRRAACRPRYGPVQALRGVDLAVARAARSSRVMGRNGAGKSTLLAHLVGLRAPDKGTVEVDGRDAAPTLGARRDRARRRWCRRTPAAARRATGRRRVPGRRPRRAAPDAAHPRAARRRSCPASPADAHPRDLSEGQRLGLALAVVLAAEPPRPAARRADPRARLRGQATV